MATATRHAVWRLGAENGWHEDVVWYAAAIQQMKELTPRLDEFLALLPEQFALPPGAEPLAEVQGIIGSWSDPRCLGYQAQVHATFRRSAWPSHEGTRVLWSECAHNHWFFLPWHRAYLLEFEAVAREHIRDLGGPADEWGLPYWNYSDYRKNPEALGLPLPLRSEEVPMRVSIAGIGHDRRNPLFDPTREMTGDFGGGDRSWADARAALLRPHYANQQDTGFVSFGGGVLEVPEQFHQSNEPGYVDAQPHGSVHVQVAGSMLQFETAGLDPVFWMHHANIDRLWETYAVDLDHGYPFDPAGDPNTSAAQEWKARKFRFLRPTGEVSSWTAPQVIHLAQLADGFRYGYDTTVSPDLPPGPQPPRPGEEDDPFGLDLATPEPVAAAHDIALVQATTVSLRGSEEGEVGFAAPVGQRWVLRLDGIRAERPVPTSYQVYLELPSEGSADPEDRVHHVGLLSLFGVFEASRDDGTSSSSGRMRLFDVTDQVRALGVDFDPLHPDVHFVPLNPDRPLEDVGLSIERLTLEVA